MGINKCADCVRVTEASPTTDYVWSHVRLAESSLLHAVSNTPQTHLLCMTTLLDDKDNHA